ncbi:MAG: hypothetical protein R3Y62_02575 [Eubacteriales bacterium]
MSRETVSNRQFFAMTTAAMVGPLTVVSAQISWLTALICGILAGLYIIIVKNLPSLGGIVASLQVGRSWVYGGYLLTTGLLTAYAASMALRAFPQAGLFPWLPLSMLAICGWIGGTGGAAVGRFAGILACFVLPALGVVLAFGAMEVSIAYLRPTLYMGDGAGVLAVSLLPAAGLWLRREGRSAGVGWTATAVALTVAISAVTVGTLGAGLAGAVDEPFYMMTKSISLFGVMERFEGLVAALLLLSFGCLVAYLSAIGGEIWRAWVPTVEKKLAPLPNMTVAVACIWLLHRLPDWLPGVLMAVFWVVLPPILWFAGKKGGYAN